MHIERFAPSPTGLLHLGHAFSALTAYGAAMAAGGRFLLRIEDIDRARCRAEFETAMMEDLRWLGIRWEQPVMRQSDRMDAYAAALARLDAMGLTYRCTCTRRDILDAVDAPQEGGPDGPIYPGLCRGGRADPDAPAAIRLDMEKATALIDHLSFAELGTGPDGETGLIAIDKADLVSSCGDIVLARKDVPTSYHLAVVVDDATQGTTHVTRGQDLFSATPIHRLLQALLALPAPIYRHHRLIRDEAGKRLAKRHDSKAIARYRAEGWSVPDLKGLLRAS
ncbi:MAG: tRNA glutamyl-Q(34) synthetase GluQRS [Pseudomonadota bacterium]